jgi:hypothetical protein
VHQLLQKFKIQIALLILIMTGIPLVGAVEAQDITPEVNLQCVYRIEGTITEQTLNDLERDADSISESMWDINAAICLDSPSGNFVVGQQMASLIHLKGWRTAVTSEASCSSACAIAFMGGTGSIGMYTYSHRVVYPGGELGFHAPSLSANEGIYSERAVNVAYQLALREILGLIDLIETKFVTGNKFLFNTYLLNKSISTPPTDLWILRTINDAVFGDIDIWAPPLQNDERFYLNLCDNFVSRYGGDGNTSNPAAQIQNERAQNRQGKPDIVFSEEYAWVPGYWRGARNTMLCRVRLSATVTYMAGPAHLVQLIEHDWNTEPPIDSATPYAVEMFRSAAPKWFGYNPNLLLSDLR